MNEIDASELRLRRENLTALKAIERNGVDLARELDIEFRVSMPNKEACKNARNSFREKFIVPQNGLFLIASYPEEFQLILSVKMVPTVDEISSIERKLLSVVGQSEVFWEFKE